MLEQVKTKLKTNDETLKLVADELIKRCETEPELIDKILNDNKSLAECWEYIKHQAKEKGKGKSSVAITDAEVYGWAIHYFWEDNMEWKNTPPTQQKSKTKKQEVDDKDGEEEEDIDEDEKPVNKQIIAKPEPTKKPKGVVDGQLSLFDM